MKKLLFISLITLSALVSAQDASYNTAGEYMGAISSMYKEVQTQSWEYLKSMAHSKSGKKVESKRTELVSSLARMRDKVADMSDYNGDASFRDSVVSFLTISHQVINGDYAEIVNMEAIAEQSYDLMEAYLMAKDQAGDKLNIANENLQESQKKFAEAHNIILEDVKDPQAEKIEKAGEVFDYYNKIYLIFFKAYKQEMYMLEAQNAKDMSTLEQTRLKLIEFSNEGLAELKKLDAYAGDNQLEEACIKALEFYKDEAENKIKTVSDFYMTEERFAKVKEMIDKKGDDRTQEDVDLYNQMAKEFNEGVATFNTTNQELNASRSALLEQWNTQAFEFTKRHVPK